MNFLKLKKLNTSILSCFVAIISISFFLTSCEKTDDIVKEDSIVKEEGNMSTTNNDTKIFIDENEEVLEPVMHMRFSDNLTKKEANAKWDIEVDKYITKYKLENPQLAERGVSTELFFRVRTKTGSQTDNDTDATVRSRLNFASNIGNLTTGWIGLDNFGDDREKGDLDYYLFKVKINNSSISWARARYAQLALQGTDGWFPKWFDILIYDHDQSVPASGDSYIISNPNVWLDNSKSSDWDYYYTGIIGYGTTYF